MVSVRAKLMIRIKKSILAMFNEIHLLNEKIKLIESKIDTFPFENQKIQTNKKIKKAKNK